MECQQGRDRVSRAEHIAIIPSLSMGLLLGIMGWDVDFGVYSATKYLQAVPVRLNPRQRTWSGIERCLPRGDSLFTGRKSSGWRSWGVAMVLM